MVHVFSEMIAESTLGFTNVQEPSLGPLDAIDSVRGDAHDPLPHLEGMLGSLDGGEGGGVISLVVAGKVPGDGKGLGGKGSSVNQLVAEGAISVESGNGVKGDKRQLTCAEVYSFKK